MIERQQYQQERELPRSSPYVVSEDIRLLIEGWAERKGFSLPDSAYFSDLRNRFRDVFSSVFDAFDLVPETELTEGVRRLVSETGLFPVSLDRVYYRSDGALDVTRLVDDEGKDAGLGRRYDSPTILEQFRTLRASGTKEVVLVDDVIFSGGVAGRVVRGLNRSGINVPVICAGIGISEGIDVLNANGQEVRCVREYPEVIDEICERDFYPGVPLSGRTLAGTPDTGVPYILPFGNPGKWASIPQRLEIPLSQFCLDQTIRLFQGIEDASGKYVRCCDLERGVAGLPRDESRFTDVLRLVS